MTNNENSSCVKMKYACAFILPQSYRNLYSIDDALKMGTIFKDLYRPYPSKNHSKHN